MSGRPIDDTFADTEDVFHKAVRRFRRKYGGDLHDLLSLAGEAFMRAYDTYDPELGGFNEWLRLCLKNTLRWAWDKERHRRRLLRSVGDPELALSRAQARRVWVIPDELSEDGMIAVATALSNCGDVPPSVAKRRVIAALKLLGWCGVRIMCAFEEVRRSL